MQYAIQYLIEDMSDAQLGTLAFAAPFLALSFLGLGAKILGE
jgi:hypothetical protein